MHKLDYKQISFLHPMLASVLTDLEDEFGEKVITSLWRKKGPGESGVHETIPLRAVDIRETNRSIGTIIEDWINIRYEYDPHRPSMMVAIHHNTGWGWHLHLQVHPRTKKVYGGDDDS